MLLLLLVVLLLFVENFSRNFAKAKIASSELTENEFQVCNELYWRDKWIIVETHVEQICILQRSFEYATDESTPI